MPGIAVRRSLITEVAWHTPASLNVQGVVTGGGGLATAPDPAPGSLSPQRWVLDHTSFRAFDGTSKNYGAPSGPGVAVEITSDGRLFLGGKAANLVIDDVNGVARVEMGSMPARGLSPAQDGLRVSGPDGTPFLDTSGVFKGIMESLGIASGSGSFSSSTFAAVSGASVSFTITRQVNLIALFLGNGQIATSGASKWGNLQTNLVGVSQSGAINYGNASTSTGMGWHYVSALPPGAYTWQLEAASNDGVTVFTLGVGVIQVFKIGG